MAAVSTSEDVDWNDEDVDWNAKNPPMSPTQGMSNLDLAAAGAGKAQLDAWRGIRQLVYNPFPGITIGSNPQSEIDEAQKLDKPLMQTPAGLAGYAGGTIADAVIPAGLAGDAARAAGLTRTGETLNAIANPSNLRSAAISGGLQGATQPVTGDDSRLWNIASGAGSGSVGQGLAKGASALVSAAADPLSQAGNKAAQALIDAGVPLDAAQRTGSVLLQRAKAMLSDNPLTAGAQKYFQSEQNKSMTKAFLQTVGASGNDASPSVMGAASSKLSNTYDDLFSRLNLPYDKVEAPLSDLLNQARIPLDDQQFAKLSRVSDDILNKASTNDGVISGEQWQNVKKTLDGISSSSDTDVAGYARDMRQTLHDGLMQHAIDTGNTADAALLKQTNQQWRNMKNIEGAITPMGDGTYQIPPSKVASVMGQKANRATSVYGRGDTALSNLADAGTSVLGEKTNQSGTIPRAMAQLGIAGAVGAGEGLYSGDWKRGAEYAAGAYAIPKVLQMGLNAQGQIGQRAMSGLGALGASTDLPTLAGGVLQKSPWASLLAAESATDRAKKEKAAQ